MWGYAIGAAAVLITGYLVNEDSKKLRVGDTAFVPVDLIGLKNVPPGLENFNLASLIPAGSPEKDVKLLVTKRIANPAGDIAEAAINTPVGSVLVTFNVRHVRIIQRGTKQQPGGK